MSLTLISTTAPNWNSSQASLTTASIAVQAGDLILVEYGDAGYYAASLPPTISNTGQSLSWTQKIYQTSNHSRPVIAAWYAIAASAGNITVTVACSVSNTYGFQVEVWRGAAGIGNTTSAYVSGTQLNTALTTGTAHSAVSFFASDGAAGPVSGLTWESINGTPMTANQLNQYSGNYSVVSGDISDAGAAASNNYGVTNKTTSSGAMMAIEITPYVAPAGPVVTLEWDGDSGFVSTGTMSKSVTRNNAVSAGDLVIACIFGNQNNNITSVVDGQIGTLSPLGPGQWDATDGVWMQFFGAISAQNYGASGGNSITVTFSSNTGYAEVVGAQFSVSAGYAFAPATAYSKNTQINPGKVAGAITTGSVTTTSQPFFFFAMSDFAGGSHDGSGQTVANGWTSTFTAASGGVVPAWTVATTTGNFSGTWTAPAASTTPNYVSLLAGWPIYSVSPFSASTDLPTYAKRKVPDDVTGSPSVLLTAVPGAQPLFTPLLDLPPLSRTLPVAVLAQDSQQQEVTGALYGQDRVLTPFVYGYYWPRGIEAMPAALRSDSYGDFPGALVVALATPAGAAYQEFTGRLLRLPDYGYFFQNTIPYYGRDATLPDKGFSPGWPVPRTAARSLALYDFEPRLLALYTFVPPRPPINQSDWPVPPAPRRFVSDFILGVPDPLLRALTTYPPFPEFDLRVPMAARQPPSLYSWEALSPNAVTEYPPYLNFDWPVPPGAPRPTLSYAETFQWGLLTPPAVLTFDWPNPLRPRVPYDLYSITSFFSRATFTPPPPTNYDWPNPLRPRTFVRNLTFDKGWDALYLPLSPFTNQILTQLMVYKLVNAGLQPQVQYAYSNVPHDYVVGTVPPGGTVLPVNTPVLVFSSQGPPNPSLVGQFVPNVVGMPAAQAVATLSASFLSIDQFQWETSLTVGEGVVLSQMPPAGSYANPGTIVTLTLSAGTTPPDYTMEKGTVPS